MLGRRLSRDKRGFYGRYLGKRWDQARRPVAGGVVVAWRGKDVVSCPPPGNGRGRYVFGDGSWADTVTGECWSAPGGVLITVTGEEADRACVALFGSSQGAFVSVNG